MSIPVAIPDLAATTATYGWAYLLTVRESARAHIVAVSPQWEGEELVMPVGRGTGRNASVHPDVTLCYPPLEPDGYSLIVDGTATVHTATAPAEEGAAATEADVVTTVRFRPTGAVLHRPAAPGFGGGPTGCGNDCLPVSEAG